MGNFELTVNVIDWIMSTSIILLDQNSNANDVDIWYLNLVPYFPLWPLGGGGGWGCWRYDTWSEQSISNSTTAVFRSKYLKRKQKCAKC